MEFDEFGKGSDKFPLFTDCRRWRSIKRVDKNILKYRAPLFSDFEINAINIQNSDVLRVMTLFHGNGSYYRVLNRFIKRLSVWKKT